MTFMPCVIAAVNNSKCAVLIMPEQNTIFAHDNATLITVKIPYHFMNKILIKALEKSVRANKFITAIIAKVTQRILLTIRQEDTQLKKEHQVNTLKLNGMPSKSAITTAALFVEKRNRLLSII